MFAERAYLDGGRGVALAFLQSTYELLVELKRWQEADFPESEKNQGKIVWSTLDKVKHDLNYWMADYQVKNTTGWKKIYWQFRRKLKI